MNKVKIDILLMKIKQRLSVFHFAIVIGIIMLLGGIYLQYSVNNFFKTAIETTATITNIDSNFEGEDVMYDVYIDYTINDYTYHSKYDTYYTGMYTGQKVITYYNPDNPYENKSKSSKYNGYLLIGFSILWIIIMYKVKK